MIKAPKHQKLAVTVSAIALTIAGNSALASENADTDIRIALTPAPSISTSDGAYAFRVAGFLQFDNVNASQTDDSWSESKIRRARFGVRGHANTNWKYDFMFEAGSGDTQLFDANITYTGFDLADIRVGQFKEPVGLEWSTGAPWWTFTDRALVASITPKRSIGVLASRKGKRWGGHVGYFDSESTISNSSPEDGVSVIRLYGIPYKKDDQLIHLGVSLNKRSPENNTVRIKAKHETAGQPTPSMDSGVVDQVSSVEVIGIEALFQSGSFSLQGEFYDQSLERQGMAGASVSAGYVQISHFLTGEKRPYKLKKGGFGRITPKGDKGAVELAARFDTLDLSDPSLSAGTMDRMTVGVNWYVNRNVRLTASYVYSETDGDARMSNGEVHSLGLRSQFTF